MASVPFGPGTVVITIASTQHSVEAEVSGGAVLHSYSESDRKAVLADVSKPSARILRDADSIRLDLVNDLTADGLYALIQANDLAVAEVTYTPNSAAAASWDGSVTLRLPDEVGASEWGDDIASTVTLPAVGTFTFTPAA